MFYLNARASSRNLQLYRWYNIPSFPLTEQRCSLLKQKNHPYGIRFYIYKMPHVSSFGRQTEMADSLKHEFNSGFSLSVPTK
jgi:hypothetical protein